MAPNPSSPSPKSVGERSHILFHGAEREFDREPLSVELYDHPKVDACVSACNDWTFAVHLHKDETQLITVPSQSQPARLAQWRDAACSPAPLLEGAVSRWRHLRRPYCLRCPQEHNLHETAAKDSIHGKIYLRKTVMNDSGNSVAHIYNMC